MPLDIRDHPTWVPTVAHAEDGAEPARLLCHGAGAGAQRHRTSGCRTSIRTARTICVTSSSSRNGSTASRTPTATASPTRRRSCYEGFNDDPTCDIAGGVLWNGGDLLIGSAPGVWRLKDDNGDGTIDRQIEHQRGLQHASGVRRPRHLGSDDRTGRPDLLGGRRHRPRRHRQERQALVVSESGRGHALGAGRIEFRGVRRRHPQPAGVLVRRARQPDQRRQRRRSPGRDRARRLHHQRLRQRLAIELAVRQVHRREEQPLQRVDGREHVQATLCRAGGAHRAARRGLSQRPVRHGLQPGHGADGRVEELLLRLELSRRRVRTRASTASSSRKKGAGFTLEDDKVILRGILTVGLQDRPGRRAVSHRLDHRLGFEEQGPHLEARFTEPARRAPMRAEVRTLLIADLRRRARCRSSRSSARSRRHAHPSEGAVRARAARRRAAAVAAARNETGNSLARLHGIWGVGAARATAKDGSKQPRC